MDEPDMVAVDDVSPSQRSCAASDSEKDTWYSPSVNGQSRTCSDVLSGTAHIDGKSQRQDDNKFHD